MKRIFSISLATALMSSVIFITPAAHATACVGFAGGDGTQADPYQVSNRAELEALDGCYAAGNYFIQTAHIDLGGESEPWLPLGMTNDFRGNYDGANFEIQNMHVVRDYQAGFISSANAAFFTRMRLIDFSVTSLQGGYTGGLVAFARDTVASQIVLKGSVTSTFMAGGMFGVHWGGQLKRISEVYVDVSVSGTSNGTGGLIGQSIAESSIIEDVFVKGTISGNSLGSGGVVGFGEHSQLRRAVSLAEVVATSTYRGGVAGYFGGNTAVFADSFHLDTAVTVISSAYPTSRTATQLRTASTYANFDIGTTEYSATKWRILDGVNDGLPFLAFTTIVNPPNFVPVIAPEPYSGPVIAASNQKVVAGQELALSGERLGNISGASLAGLEASIQSQTATSLVVLVPAGLASGSYDLVLFSDQGKLTVQSAINIIASGATANSLPVRSEARLLGESHAKIYAFDLVEAGKVQIIHNGKEVAWVSAKSTSDVKLRAGYLVRTIALSQGENLIQVLVAGKTIQEFSFPK